MAGPWEKYQQPPAEQVQVGPWAKYAGTQFDESYGAAPAQGDGDLQAGESTGLEIPIVGGTPMGEGQIRSPLAAQVGDGAPSAFNMDRATAERFGLAGAGTGITAAAKDMFGSEKGVAEYLAQQSGGRVVRAPEGGYGLILPDGSQFRVNEPGMDSADVANVAGNIAAAFLPASWAGRVAQARNIGTIGRVGLQGAAAGAQDAGMHAAVSNGKVDVGRAAISAAGGGLGELAGTGLSAAGNKLGQLSRMRSGANRREAVNMLADAGIDRPQTNVLAQLAPQVEQVRLGADPRTALGSAEFGFQYTQGQRLTDAAKKHAQLSKEEVLRQSPGGAAAFEGLQSNNLARLGEAVDDIGGRLGGQPMASPGELVQGSAGRLRQQADELRGRVDDAYANVRNADTVAVSRQTVSSVPDRLRGAVREFDIHPSTTPGAFRALEQVQAATSHILGNKAVNGVTLRALETQRRILGNAVGGAANPADRAALMAIRREFDGWMDEAIDTALVTGDQAALSQLKQARALRAEFGRRFEGGKDADKFIAGLLDGSRTPEELMNTALGAAQVSKSAAARFIARLRTAANDDPAVMGGLRAAHFARLTRGKDGKSLAPGDILRNIRETEYSNASVAKALYTDAEWAEIRRLGNALEPMLAKGDFAKSSGTAERIWRMLMSVLRGGAKIIPGVNVATEVLVGGKQSLGAKEAISGALRPYNQANPVFPAAGKALTEDRPTD